MVSKIWKDSRSIKSTERYFDFYELRQFCKNGDSEGKERALFGLLKQTK